MKFPLVKYFNGYICWEVTDYIVDLFRLKALKQQTLDTYMNHLRRWVDFLFVNKLSFSHITDSILIDYAKYLKGLKKPRNNQINKLIRAAIKHLIWLQSNKYIPETVAKDGSTAVTICEETVHVKGRYSRQVIHHVSLLETNSAKTVLPVALSTINKIFESIPLLIEARPLQRRIEYMLDCFINTAGRRGEVCAMRVADVNEALSNAKENKGPLTIRLPWKKGQSSEDPKFRSVPLLRSTLDKVKSYIELDRAEIIRTAISRGHITRDHGMLWVTSCGRPMSEKTITDYIGKLRKLGGVEADVWPHMFRHRTLTIIAAEMIESLKNSGSPFHVWVDIILVKLTEISGHSDPNSLLTYIHAGFQESKAFVDLDRLITERLERDDWQLSIANLKSVLHEYDQQLNGCPTTSRLRDVAHNILTTVNVTI